MSEINKTKLYRILDANFNRSKEGLRVCEDVTRFVLDEAALSRNHKRLRHKLTDLTALLKIAKLIEARQIERDVGRSSFKFEGKRNQIKDIYLANAQRVKESIRVLEEFTKINGFKHSEDFKKLRYSFYELEKKTVKKL